MGATVFSQPNFGSNTPLLLGYSLEATLGPAHTQTKEITQGRKYQEMEITGGHLEADYP